MDRNATLDGEFLREQGYAINPERTAIRDSRGGWWGMAWSSHLGRYESSTAHIDAILRMASTGRAG